MNQVLYWNAILLEASRRDHSLGYANNQQAGPTATSRAMAIVHLAIHDAVAYLALPAAAYLKKKVNLSLVPPAGAVQEDVIDGAAHAALIAMYPNYAAYFADALGPTDAASFAFGQQIAAALLEVRADDGANLLVPTPATHDYGQHRVDPYNPKQDFLGAHWGNVKHFVGPRKHIDRFPGYALPNYLADPHYRQDYEEVRDLGRRASPSRTPEQTLVGVYWGYDGAQGIGVPPRLYNQIVRKLVPADMSVAAAAELFAQVNVAMADAGIDSWHAKYHPENNLWRPVVGIREEADPDGDPFWAPLGLPQTNKPGAGPATPPFPAYPSGHATFGAALFQTLRLRSSSGAAPISVAEVLAAAADDAPVAGESFSFVSDELDGRAIDADGSLRTRVEHAIPGFARAVYDNAVSRVHLGVHWRFDGLPRDAADNIGGVPLGLAIGEQVHEYFNNVALTSLQGV